MIMRAGSWCLTALTAARMVSPVAIPSSSRFMKLHIPSTLCITLHDFFWWFTFTYRKHNSSTVLSLCRNFSNHIIGYAFHSMVANRSFAITRPSRYAGAIATQAFNYAAPCFRDVMEYTLVAGEQQRFVERYWKIPS